MILPGIVVNVMKNGLNILCGYSLIGYLPIEVNILC